MKWYFYSLVWVFLGWNGAQGMKDALFDLSEEEDLGWEEVAPLRIIGSQEQDLPIESIIFLESQKDNNPYVQEHCKTRAIGSLSWKDVPGILRHVYVTKSNIEDWNYLLEGCHDLQEIGVTGKISHANQLKLPGSLKSIRITSNSRFGWTFHQSIKQNFSITQLFFRNCPKMDSVWGDTGMLKLTHLAFQNVDLELTDVNEILAGCKNLVYFEFLDNESGVIDFPEGNKIEEFHYRGDVSKGEFQEMLRRLPHLKRLRASQNVVDTAVDYDICKNLEEISFLQDSEESSGYTCSIQ